MDRWEEQLALELEMRDRGAARFQKRLAYAREHGTEASGGAGGHVLKTNLNLLAGAIRDWMAEAETGKAGRRPTAVKYLREEDPHTLAYLTLKVALDGASAPHRPLQQAAQNLSRCIEDEIRVRGAQKAAPGLIAKVQKQIKLQGRQARRSTIMRLVLNRYAVDEWVPWGVNTRLQVGTALLNVMLQTLPWFTLEMMWIGPKKTQHCLRATEQLETLLRDRNARMEIMQAVWMPCVIPPKDWVGPHDGGYWHPISKAPIMKVRNSAYLEELANRVDDMPALYASINALQHTGWRVNRQVLDVMALVWEAGRAVGKLPSSTLVDLPNKPVDIETNEEARKAYRMVAAKAYQQRHKSLSRRVQAAGVLAVATRFAEYPAIYWVYQLDWRGRAYPMCGGAFHPQGADPAKGLLEFAEGKAIATEEQARWLAIHGANLWGKDKVPMDERVAWAEANTELVRRVASDPLAYGDWMDADKPWQALAWCIEWTSFKAAGLGFISHLPVAMDGSCNGLQHFSAMLRDAVGGGATNLRPADRPQDIYQIVADRTMTRLEADVEAGGEAGELAGRWLRWGINRKTTKRSVMVVPYGGTFHACMQYIGEHVSDRLEHGEEDIFGEQRKTAEVYLARLVWAAISDTVVAARVAMDWLQKSARVVAAENLPVVWTTPVGLPVMQAYPDLSDRRVKTHMGDSLIYFTLHETIPGRLDAQRQAQGVAPNFVHSLDGAHMMLTISRSLEQGVSSFAMVHDSYGTHAADAPVLAETLRAVFVDMYEEHDVLQEFRAGVAEVLTTVEELPGLPKRGSLDIQEVRGATFFFA